MLVNQTRLKASQIANVRGIWRQVICKHRPTLLVAGVAEHAATKSLLATNASRASFTPNESGGRSVQKPKVTTKQIAQYCSACGGKIKLAIPPGEAELRHVCTKCHTVTYYNPKMVVGVICEHEGKILLCKRAIEPCRGLWTVPAGYMEMSESSAEGAARETWEEAGARVEIIAPYVHFDIPRIGQAYVLFRAKLKPPYMYETSAESLETVLLQPEEIPMQQLAFSSVSLALRFYLQDMRSGKFRVHHGVIEKAAYSKPNDPHSYVLRDHIALTVEETQIRP